MEFEESLLSKERETKKYVCTDDVLDEIGPKNAYIVFVFIAMGFTWCVAAPISMINAFVLNSDDSHCTVNTSCVPTVSITSEFALTGDKSALAATSMSVSMIGDIFGAFILSSLSDRYGRKPVVCLSALSIGTFGVLSSLAPNIYVFIALRFCQGAFTSGITIVNWVLAYESLPHAIRSYASMLFGSMWVLGYCLTSPIAYFTHDWRTMFVVTSVPAIVVGLVYTLIIPESIHFLVSKRKEDKTRDWMEKAERWGDRQLTISAEQLLENMALTHKPDNGSKTTSDNIRQILRNRRLLTDLCVMAYLWIANSFVYGALALFSTDLAGNRYVNFALIGLAELPAYVVAPFLLDKFGRRKIVFLGHVITGCAMLAAIFLSAEDVYATLALWLIAKCSVASSFTNIFVYASEVFPTTYRTLCIGLCTLIAKVVTIGTPHVGSLKAVDPRLPTIFYAFLGVTSALATLLLPETLNKPLPTTVSDVQEE